MTSSVEKRGLPSKKNMALQLELVLPKKFVIRGFPFGLLRKRPHDPEVQLPVSAWIVPSPLTPPLFKLRVRLLASDGSPLFDPSEDFVVPLTRLYEDEQGNWEYDPVRGNYTLASGPPPLRLRFPEASPEHVGGVRFEFFRRSSSRIKKKMASKAKHKRVLVAAACVRISSRVLELEDFVLQLSPKFGVPGKSLEELDLGDGFQGPLLGVLSVEMTRGSHARADAARNVFQDGTPLNARPGQHHSKARDRQPRSKLREDAAPPRVVVEPPKDDGDDGDHASGDCSEATNLLSRSLSKSIEAVWDDNQEALESSACISLDISSANWGLEDGTPERSIVKSSEVSLREMLAIDDGSEIDDDVDDRPFGGPKEDILKPVPDGPKSEAAAEPRPPRSPLRFSTGLTQSSVLAAGEHEIEMIRDVLGINKELAVVLLRHYSWDHDRLVSEYLDDSERVAKAVGLSQDDLAESQAVVPGGTESGRLCLSCYDDDEHEIVSLPFSKCRDHTFCSDCWRTYIAVKAKEADVVAMRCMAEGCNKFLPEDFIRQVASAKDLEKLVQFTAAQYVDTNAALKWCPRAGCGRAISEKGAKTLGCGNTVAKCGGCQYRLCFSCMQEDHSPATCDQAKQWRDKLDDESDNDNWIAANTKPCPKCAVPIEKNDGCFCMTCGSCYHSFCWLCLKDWATHGDHMKCTTYNENKLDNKPEWRNDKDAEIDVKRAHLNKYMFYFNRFANHNKSEEYEVELSGKLEEMLEPLMTHGLSLADCSFMEESFGVLQECRSVLKWAVVWSYCVDALVDEGDEGTHLTKKDKKRAELALDLFNETLSQLEGLTEQLAQKLERELHEVLLPGKRYALKHLARVCRKTTK
jgi:ariadne-1